MHDDVRAELLTNKALPGASSPVVTCDESIRVETHDLGVLEGTAYYSWCARVVSEQNLQEDLSIPDEGRRVEWRSVVCGVDKVLQDRHRMTV